MVYTVLDIETTGLLKFDANGDLIPDLLEVAYLRVDSTNLKILGSGTLYFYQPHFDIENDAQGIHKLTRTFLAQYENQFEENIRTLSAMLTNGVVVGKNSKKFDIPFINHFISKYVGKKYDIGDITSRAAMKAYDKKSIVYHESNIQHIDIQDLYSQVYRVKKYLTSIGEIDKFYSKDFKAADFDEIASVTDKRKRGSLVEYIDMMPQGREYTKSLYDSLEKERATTEHGALYDVCMTYVIWLDYIILKGRLK